MDDPTIAAESKINDLERIMRNAGPLALSHSSFLQAELYLSNFERLRDDLSILINNYIEEPAILAHLMELWDRMEAALTGYLAKKAEMVEHGVIPVPSNEPLDLNYEADFAEAERVQRFEWMADNRTPNSSVERSDDDREAARASLPQPDPASRIECLICGDEYPGNETFIFQCHHQYCIECVVGMLETGPPSFPRLSLVPSLAFLYSFSFSWLVRCGAMTVVCSPDKLDGILLCLLASGRW